MGMNVTRKILSSHSATGDIKNISPGQSIALKIDQTLTQDATGTMAYLEFEVMGIERVKTKLSVSYIDHNTLQTGFENADDHLFLQTFASKYGIYLSKAGNGICHQVHLERFGIPGQTLLGSDSHTPTGGGLGMIAIGAGGIDVACAMAGAPFNVAMPVVVGVKLKGKLRPWVSAKDIILELLRRLSVKGGVGRIFEYTGEGVKTLTVPERATITNMGAELGATTSIFSSDSQTLKFLKAQNREHLWENICADKNAEYDEVIEIDLTKLVPLAAQPHMPDRVCSVKDIEGMKVDQVLVGSCTNSSYKDLMTVSSMLKNKKISDQVSFGIAPGSRQVLEMISRNGALLDIVQAGARVLEVACGPCIGMGQSPQTKAVSLRTFNRNFEGRSGTPSADIYLVSPEVAVASAIKGVITDPRKLGKSSRIVMPKQFLIDDSMIISPSKKPKTVKVVKGPNIATLPKCGTLPRSFKGEVLLHVGDNITTDHICPAGAKVLPYRSNVPKLSEFVYQSVDKDFSQNALSVKSKGIAGIIIGGNNYGQGSSREHAALCPMYLGVKVVIALSFARIHKANLINFGILPLTFENGPIYKTIKKGEALSFPNIQKELKDGVKITVELAHKKRFYVKCDISERERNVLLSGGILAYMGSRNS